MTERLLMTVDQGDAEPVVVEADSEQVTLTLVDGRVIPLDRRELENLIVDGKEAA